MYSDGPTHMAGQKQDDQLEHTFSSYVRIWGVALKTCQRRWTIGRSGERGSGISVPVAWHDDDDVYIYGGGVTGFRIKYVPLGWGCKIHPLQLCRGVRLSQMSVLFMTQAILWWIFCNTGALGNSEYSFIAIDLRSSLTRSGYTR